MPRVEESTLLLLDTALQGVGVLILGIVLLRVVGSGRGSNPLAQLGFTGNAPNAFHLVGVFAFYLLLYILLRSALLGPEPVRIDGSPRWHLLNCVDGGAKLAACALMMFILHRRRPFRPAWAARLGPDRLLGVSVAVVLVIMPLSYVQLHAGQIVWRWLAPGAQQPIHPVLRALEDSAWGPWGSVQLSIAAVLVVPLAEELFFRGLLLQAVWGHWGRAWPAVVLSGVAFGLVHKDQPQDVVPLITMGVILGYVRVRYRSLSACVVAHSLFNARTMAFALLNPELVRGGW